MRTEAQSAEYYYSTLLKMETHFISVYKEAMAKLKDVREAISLYEREQRVSRC